MVEMKEHLGYNQLEKSITQVKRKNLAHNYKIYKDI